MTGPKKILIADDDEFIRNAYAHKFQEEGYEVAVVGDGEEAWKLLESGYVPNVVFTSILMPKMSGFELVRKMRPDPRFTAIPIVISSHRGRQEDKEEALWLGVNDFLIQGLVPITEAVRRINLVLGENITYFVPLERNDRGANELARLLEVQQKSFLIADKTKKLFLKIEPTKEPGEFKIALTDEGPKNKLYS
jgi:CheY-like chemotaxis protein